MEFNIINPKNKTGLLSAIRKEKRFRFGAGCTDLLMELKNYPQDGLTIINLSQVKDAHFNGMKKSVKGYRLGAMLTADKISNSEEIKKEFPVLHEAARSLASTQIRQVATIGGNLCTASPSGDIACAMVALNAQCEIMGISGKIRTAPITQFFLGPRKTVLKTNELLYVISVPANIRNSKNIKSGFIKIGTRSSMECSIVSLAYHIQVDEENNIVKAGVAIGAAAPTIRFAKTACEFLIGKNINDLSQKEKVKFAESILKYASPITDIRATSWYRKEVLFNISKSIFE